MSLVAQAIITTVRNLLTGRTWAGDNVVESPVDPITDMGVRSSTDIRAPFIAVYVERVSQELHGQGGEADLKIYVYLPTDRVLMPDGVVYQGVRKNAGMTLNLVARQVENALSVTISPWAEIWRRLVIECRDTTVRPLLIEIENGVRIPAIEITNMLKIMSEPLIGEPLGQTFQMFDAALRAAEGNGLADVIKTMIEAPAGLPAYLDTAMQLQMSSAAIEALGIMPVRAEDLSEGETDWPPLAGVDLVDPLPEGE